MDVEYMRLWVMANLPAYKDEWTDDEVAGMFFMLPSPAVSFEEWLSIVTAEPPTVTDKIDALMSVVGDKAVDERQA